MATEDSLSGSSRETKRSVTDLSVRVGHQQGESHARTDADLAEEDGILPTPEVSAHPVENHHIQDEMRDLVDLWARFDDGAHLDVDTHIEMTPDETEALAEDLLEAAELVRGRDSDRYE